MSIHCDAFLNFVQTKLVTVSEGVPVNWMGLDVGPESTQINVAEVKKSKTIVWNGLAEHVLYY